MCHTNAISGALNRMRKAPTWSSGTVSVRLYYKKSRKEENFVLTLQERVSIKNSETATKLITENTQFALQQNQTQK